MVEPRGSRDQGNVDAGSRLPPAPSLFRRFLPQIDHRTTGEVLQHPRFAEMRRHYIATTMAQYEFANFPGGWQSTIYRVAAIGAIVCLHAAYDSADRATWPTLARFKEAMATFGLSSARQIDDFVARLVETGYVVLERVATDGRLRLLKPTEQLLDWDRTGLAGYYEALRILYPDTGYDLPVARDREFQLTMRKASTSYFPQIAAFIREDTDLLPFLSMYQGVHILMHVIDLNLEPQSRPVRERDLAGLQRRFGISRSHIRNTLSTAEAAGLITVSGRSERLIAATPRGLAAIDRFIANTLASHDLGYRMAIAELGHAADPRDRPDRPQR